MIDLTGINVIYLKLPAKVNATVADNADGSYTVVINSSLSEDQQQKALFHEVNHIRRGKKDSESVEDIERDTRATSYLESKIFEQKPIVIKPFASEFMDNYSLISFKVAGVTFSSGNELRQDMLKRLKSDIDSGTMLDRIELHPYLYELEPAAYVNIGGQTIGNVPKQLVSYVLGSNIAGATQVSVYGGEEGKAYGCQISLAVEKIA